MRALEHLVGSRPARIRIILLRLILDGLGGSSAPRFQSVQKNEESSFLPGSSESMRELTLAKRFPSGQRFAAITIVRRDGGLKPRDLAAIERTRASLAANPPVTGSRQVLVRVSPDRTTALVVVNLNPRGNGTLLKSSVSTIDSRMAPLPARRLTVNVTGPAGFSRDAVNVFASINGTLLLATGALVFVLLILIYRSPIFWVIPLFSMLMAEARRYERPVDAMRQAPRRAGPDRPCSRRGRRSSSRCCACHWRRSTAPAGGDLPVHLCDDQPEPGGRRAEGHRRPAVEVARALNAG